MDQYCRFAGSCVYLLPDYSEEGNKKIKNQIKVELESLKKATKEGIDQIKATAQYI